jgi:uncharacterized protein YegP (UPF0339 family)
MDRVNVYKDAKGEFRWERHINGDKVANCGEGYKNQSHAVEMAIKLNIGSTIYVFGEPLLLDDDN